MPDMDGVRLEPLGGGYFCAVTKTHSFGTDALLLADFAQPKSAKRLCDLCAGCGIVSLLWSAQNPETNRQIDAIEIQRDAVSLIEHSAQYNGFSGLYAVEADLRTLDSTFYGKYDLVACNPPYKKTGTGALSREEAALFARHESICTLDDVLSCSARLLKNCGRLCLCHRPERLADLMVLMRKHGLEPKRLRFVAQRSDTKPWLVLIEGKKSAKPGLIAQPVFIIENENGEYSREMREIYQKLEKSF